MARIPDLRLIVITDASLAASAAPGRSIDEVVEAALSAGAPAIQLRAKTATGREMIEHARRLRPVVHSHGALLFINDRLDIALLSGADGVHLGPQDIPVHAARSAVPPDFLIGYSTDDPELARQAQNQGASYIGCGAVFGTRTKLDIGDEQIGVDRLRQVVDAVDIPVVAIGGITTANAAQALAAGAAGVAVAGAVMGTADPARAVRELLGGYG